MFCDISNSYQGTKELKEWRHLQLMREYINQLPTDSLLYPSEKTEECMLCLSLTKMFLI